MTRQNDSTRSNRRRFLAGSAAIGAVTLAGCTDLVGAPDNEETTESSVGQIGSGREGRPAPGGTPVAEMPDLEGELQIYSGRGEFLVGELISFLDDTYPDFDPVVRYNSGSDLVNQILNEGEGTPADVFYTVDSGGLGALADEGRTRGLSSEITDPVRDEFYTDQWVGTSGRARSIPFNTNAYSESEIPSDVMEFPDFEGDMGWAPSYPSCQGFVTAMRQIEGEEATREWLEGIVDAGIEPYPDEFAVSQAVADGELDAGFANHYYIQRVLDGSPNAPIQTAFTSGDAGSIFDVAGAAVIDETDRSEMAENFIRHLLSAEAQEYFATSTFEYPVIPEVDPVGRLPSIDELDVPNLRIAELDLSDVDATIDLMRDVGIQT
ncbi:extracellular solute-binding protein [Halohasta litorea]|uniref:Extracellular solute-binding protein n=1 Tax=Halohasta litorea TaxID=869891 RepID=A0ABD6D336_9EURY|nr:extracellular solute-binding protein [Halohasta litorea]